MVGHRFCERLTELDTSKDYRIVTFCEEPRAAYDRVGLSGYFTHRDPRRLMLAEGCDAAHAAQQVGYESPSQFSREYRRLFGHPPRADIDHVKATL